MPVPSPGGLPREGPFPPRWGRRPASRRSPGLPGALSGWHALPVSPNESPRETRQGPEAPSPARSTRPAAPRGCPGDAPLRTRGAARAREGGAGVRPRGPASPGGPRGTRPPSRADRDRLKEGRAAQLDPGSPPQPAAPHCRPTSAEAPHARAAPRARTPASLPATHPPCRKPRGFSRQPRSRSHALSLRSVSGKRLSRRRRREGLRSRPPLRQDCRVCDL